MIIVQQTDSGWVRFAGDMQIITVMVSTCNITYGDGRVDVDQPCDPYPVQRQVSPLAVARLVDEGAWDAQDLAEYGLATAEPFVAPDGKIAVGAERFEVRANTVWQVFDVADAPAPESTADRLNRMLSAFGLTKDDLREGLSS